MKRKHKNQQQQTANMTEARFTFSQERPRFDEPELTAVTRDLHHAAMALLRRRQERDMAVGTPNFERASAEFDAFRERLLQQALNAVPKVEAILREKEQAVCMAPRGPARDRANALSAMVRFALDGVRAQVRMLKGEMPEQEIRELQECRPTSIVVVVPRSDSSGCGDVETN